jgi:hypothetical protein
LIDLLPCPFCGGPAKATEFGPMDTVVTCLNCTAETTTIDDWIRRIDKKAAGFDYLLNVLKSHHMTKPGISTLVQKAEKMVAW